MIKFSICIINQYQKMSNMEIIIKSICLHFVDIFILDDEIDEDDIEGNKPLTMEEFR